MAQGEARPCRASGSLGPRGCDAYALAVTGGDSKTTLLRAAYLFDSARRAESGRDDIKEAIQDSDRFDADGDPVTVELTFHEE